MIKTRRTRQAAGACFIVLAAQSILMCSAARAWVGGTGAFPSEQLPMANEFDPYREALVLEQLTEWPDDYDGWETLEKQRVASALQAEPQQAAQLEYVRIHSGFCRKITVTPEDLARLGVAV